MIATAAWQQPRTTCKVQMARWSKQRIDIAAMDTYYKNSQLYSGQKSVNLTPIRSENTMCYEGTVVRLCWLIRAAFACAESSLLIMTSHHR
jgi:hypothetical protein